MCRMPINVYWTINSYCPGNNYHIHPVFNFDPPTHWGIMQDIYQNRASEAGADPHIVMGGAQLDITILDTSQGFQKVF